MIKTFDNIPAVSDKDTQGKRIYNKIEVLREADVDYGQLPAIDEENRTIEDFTLKEDAVGWKELNLVKYTPSATSEGSAGDVTSAVTNTITGTLGGDRNVIDNLLENHVGEAFFVRITDRFNQKKVVYGRPYSPLFLTAFSKRKTADNTSCDVTFSNESFFQPLELKTAAAVAE